MSMVYKYVKLSEVPIGAVVKFTCPIEGCCTVGVKVDDASLRLSCLQACRKGRGIVVDLHPATVVDVETEA